MLCDLVVAKKVNLTEEQTRVLDLYRKDYIRSGVQLSENDQQKLIRITARLAELGVKFSQNILAEERLWELKLSEKDLEGLTNDLKSILKQAGIERGYSTPVLTLSRSHLVPFLESSSRRDLRKKVHSAWISRCGNNNEHNNYEIIPKNNFDEITGQPVQKKYFSEKDIINSDDLQSFTLQFTDKKLDLIDDVKGVFDQVTGLNTDSGRMFRLYNAAFRRFPDSSGLKYWIDQFSSGANDIRTVSSSFLVSDEFKLRYGENVSDNQYVKTLYINVLNRELDQSGYDYWVGNLSNGIEQRHEVLLGFAESAENKSLFKEMTGFG